MFPQTKQIQKNRMLTSQYASCWYENNAESNKNETPKKFANIVVFVDYISKESQFRFRQKSIKKIIWILSISTTVVFEEAPKLLKIPGGHLASNAHPYYLIIAIRHPGNYSATRKKKRLKVASKQK